MDLKSSWDAIHPSWLVSTGDVAFYLLALGDPGPLVSNSADLTAGEGCQAPPPWARSAAGLKELVCLQLHLAMKVASDLTRDHVPSPDILELLKVSQHHRQDPAASPNHCLTLTPPHLCDGTR